jgi:hypothetical protein
MPAIWVGASLVLAGLVWSAARSLWRAWPGQRSAGSSPPPAILQTDEPDIGFDLGSNPCFALIALGIILLLAGIFALLDPDSDDRSALTAGADGQALGLEWQLSMPRCSLDGAFFV